MLSYETDLIRTTFSPFWPQRSSHSLLSLPIPTEGGFVFIVHTLTAHLHLIHLIVAINAVLQGGYSGCSIPDPNR